MKMIFCLIFSNKFLNILTKNNFGYKGIYLNQFKQILNKKFPALCE